MIPSSIAARSAAGRSYLVDTDEFRSGSVKPRARLLASIFGPLLLGAKVDVGESDVKTLDKHRGGNTYVNDGRRQTLHLHQIYNKQQEAHRGRDRANKQRKA